MFGETVDSNFSISNGSTKEFEWQIYCNDWFSDRAFYVNTIAEADIGSLKSLHTLFGKYLDHISLLSKVSIWFVC